MFPFEESDLPLLKKLKVKTLLDLALIMPTSYDDNTLSRKILDGENIVVFIKVISTKVVNSKLHAEILLKGFNIYATAVFFRTTPYHFKTFRANSEHLIKGKVSFYNNYLYILQPKVMKDTGRIIPRYKVPINEKEFRRLILKYVLYTKLIKTPIYSNREEIHTLYAIHQPTDMRDLLNEFGEIREKHIKNLKMIEAINHIFKLRRKRVYKRAKKALKGEVDSFIRELPFQLTSDQLRVIEEIKRDLSQDEKATRRVILGDVGSGKTIIILAAAMVANRDKALLMAPTSILANQLFEEATKYLSKFLKVALITQKKEIGDYKSADFIIGTHALLYRDDLPKVSLVMVDEQHRFGTNQRAMLEHFNKEGDRSPHFLQFSATPIPRTQAMIESEAVDMSIIRELPFEKKIETKIIKREDFKGLLEHIKGEIDRGYQVLIVYPLVEPSSSIPYTSLMEGAEFWKKHFKNVYITHGKDKEKDETLMEFREKGDILLSTTVVEVGISLPRLTTIVIVGAERFGLATLHQLRGRVGRYGVDSYCFLYTNQDKPAKRLVEFSQILDGFKIAELDLKYRNSGDLLDGTSQSGKAFKWLNLLEDEEIIKEAKERVKNFENLKELPTVESLALERRKSNPPEITTFFI